MTAVYEGDGNFAGSASASFDQVVTQTAISLAPVAGQPVAGQPITLTADISVVGPGGGTPTGSVEFYDGAYDLGSAALDAGNETASLVVSCLGGGNHYLTAVYLGNANFVGSSSAAIEVVVGQDATTTSLTLPTGAPAPGQPATFTAAVVAAQPGSGTPSGTVEFLNGANELGTANLDATGTAARSH